MASTTMHLASTTLVLVLVTAFTLQTAIATEVTTARSTGGGCEVIEVQNKQLLINTKKCTGVAITFPELVGLQCKNQVNGACESVHYLRTDPGFLVHVHCLPKTFTVVERQFTVTCGGKTETLTYRVSNITDCECKSQSTSTPALTLLT